MNKKPKKILLKPVLTKKGLKALGGTEKLKCLDIILKGIDEGNPY